ncbi:5899_t:CDS:2 [Entrophospora sp. SA101]|nr:5899_t:CDS:2 [Entrophospora sp. SA101]
MNSQAKSDKVLTPEYLDWYSKLTDLPTKLYKIYKEKTGLNPWIKSETSESPQSENADNHILQDSSLKTQGTGNALPILALKYNVSYARIREIWKFAIVINN